MTGDIEKTMSTMSTDCEVMVMHVPSQMGGIGRTNVREFYLNHLVGKMFPEDTEIEVLSLTVGEKSLVEEVETSSHFNKIN